MIPKARIIAFYLPQFHPIAENDKWWGKGFTEWTNVAKARPLFKGHYQPHIPSDLGFYDLRLDITRIEQANMAKEAGVEGFCYWHYWFGGGRMLLERPFNEVLKSRTPDFPFCLGWANHDWTTGTWQNDKGAYTSHIIMKQEYPGIEDYYLHFQYVLPAFKDHRYIRIDGKPVFYIFAPLSMPDAKEFIETWRKLAHENGLKDIYFIGSCQSFQPNRETVLNLIRGKITIKPYDYFKELFDIGFDGVNSRGENMAFYKSLNRLTLIKRQLVKRCFNRSLLAVCDQKDINKHLFTQEDRIDNIYPTVIPNFDRSPRAGKRAIIWNNSTPKLFEEQLTKAIKLVEERPYQNRLIFLQSWNEWGEGNHVEPDLKHGRGYIEALRKTIFEN